MRAGPIRENYRKDYSGAAQDICIQSDRRGRAPVSQMARNWQPRDASGAPRSSLRGLIVVLLILVPACAALPAGDPPSVSPAALAPETAEETPEDAADETIDAAVYQITLRPDLGADGEVAAITVTSTLSGGLDAGESRLKLSSPVVYVNVMGIADRILDLDVSDAAGEIGFSIAEDEPVPGGFPYFRHWTATREVTFPLALRYRALVQPEGGPPGPSFGMRPSKGGVSGAGAGFMILPSNAASRRSVLNWDLSAFGPGALAVSTFGEGRVEVEGPPASLMQGWLMAGRAGQHPRADEDSHFRAYWLGTFPFDIAAEMEYAKTLYDHFGVFFEYLDPQPDYRVFMRQLDTPPFGGATALANSFMLSRGPARPEESSGLSPRSTLAHEMIHMWVGGLTGEHILTNWFSEGLTTYYEHTLPFRDGRVSIADYIAELNKISDRYYTNSGAGLPAAEIGRVGFGSGNLRQVPYYRGAFYFADLDARIRAASAGQRTLDMLVREIFVRRRSGDLALTIESWNAAVSAELGVEEAPFVHSVHIDGAVIYPAPESFGDCVRGERQLIAGEDADFEGMRWARVPDVAPEACFADAGAP